MAILCVYEPEVIRSVYVLELVRTITGIGYLLLSKDDLQCCVYTAGGTDADTGPVVRSEKPLHGSCVCHGEQQSVSLTRDHRLAFIFSDKNRSTLVTLFSPSHLSRTEHTNSSLTIVKRIEREKRVTLFKTTKGEEENES